MRRRLDASKISGAYLAAMLGPFIAFVGFAGYGSITASKGAAFFALTAVYAVTLAFGLKKAKLGAGQWLAVALAALAVLSTAFSVNVPLSLTGGARWEGLAAIILYVIAFLGVSMSAAPGKTALWFFAAGMTVCSAVALLQLAGLNPLSLYPEGYTYYDGNIRYSGEFLGTVGNADLLSAVNSLAVPALAVAAFKLRGRERAFVLVPLALTLAVMLWAKTAGGLVGIAAAALVVPPVLAETPRMRKILIAASVVILLAAVLAVYFFGGSMPGSIREAHELMHGRVSETFGSGRIYIWSETVKLVPERLLLGGGPMTLGVRTDAAFERQDETYGLIRNVIDVAHCEYLDILVNRGVLSLGCYLALLVLGFIRWLRRARENAAIAVAGAGALGYAVQAVFGISAVNSAPLMWIALGVLFIE